MKLILVLLAVYCCAVVSSPVRTDKINKLIEVLKELSLVKEGLQDMEKMMNTPGTIEDCCSLKALECFRKNIKDHLNFSEKNVKKLVRSLELNLTMRGVNFCSSGNSTQTCSDCESHPKAKAKDFFNRLETFIQKALSRLHSDN